MNSQQTVIKKPSMLIENQCDNVAEMFGKNIVVDKSINKM